MLVIILLISRPLYLFIPSICYLVQLKCGWVHHKRKDLNKYHLAFKGQSRQWHPAPVLLPGKSYGRRSLVGCSPWGHRVRHNWATSLSLFTLHWRRKWQPTPVFLPGESQGRGSLVSCHLWGCRVGHDWNNLAAAAAPNEMRDICGFLGEPWERRPQGLRRGERELLIMIIIILTI